MLPFKKMPVPFHTEKKAQGSERIALWTYKYNFLKMCLQFITAAIFKKKSDL